MMLECKNLSGGYEANNSIVKDVNFVVETGKSAALFGRNGAGKSTLAKAIIGLLPRCNGSVIFNQIPITSMPTHQISKMGIAYFWQGGAVFPALTVSENLRVASLHKSEQDINRFIEQLTEMSDKFLFIKQNGSEKATNLSGGNRHLLALAMVLAQTPKFLILDEPSAGLAPDAVKDIYKVLALVKEQYKLTILLIEQNIGKAIEFCDSFLILRTGKIIKQIPMQEADTYQIIEDILYEQ